MIEWFESISINNNNNNNNNNTKNEFDDTSNTTVTTTTTTTTTIEYNTSTIYKHDAENASNRNHRMNKI
jgi:hypothetical protein